jgi:FHS family Na+ dependent glucose MFS transporter 1
MKPRSILTATLYFCFINYGIGFTILSPTILDIAQILDEDFDKVSYGVVARAGSYAIFAMFFGWLFNRVNRQMAMVSCLIGSGIIVVLVPYSKSLAVFIIYQLILGLTTSGVDVGGNAWILEMWQEDSNPYMQGMHFSYAIGLVIAPLISEPFLSKPLGNDMTSKVFATRPRNRTQFTESRIYIPYSISGLLLFVSAFALYTMYFIIPYKQERTLTSSKDTEEENGIHERDDAPVRSYFDHKFLVILGSFMMCFYTGVELNAFAFFPDFAYYSSMNITKSTATFMTSIMAGAFALFRGIGILTATKITTARMLHVHFVVTTLGNVLLLLAGIISCINLTWVSIVVMGIGMSCMFPTIYSYLEERIVVTNTLTGVLFFSKEVALVVCPIIIGLNIERFPMIFVYVNIFSNIVCVGIVSGLIIVDRRHRIASLKNSKTSNQ